MNNLCYLFDIDGTLADATHRLHFIQEKPKDWGSFFAACTEDKPIDHIVQLARVLASHDYEQASLVFVSGRSNAVRKETEDWLEKYVVAPVNALYMRRAGDHRSDDIVKSELLDLILEDGWAPIMAFDDRDRVVDMWRGRGIPCAQVAPGNF